LPALRQALAARCPAAVDVEWIESLDAASAVAALRPAHSGRGRIDPAWVPDTADVHGLLNGFHRLTAGGVIRPMWGARSVTMELPTPLEVPVGAFFQGNRHLVRWLFSRVGELCGSVSVPTWDLHAGVGFVAAAVRWASNELHDEVLVEPFRPAARAATRNLPGAHVAAGHTAEQYLAKARRLPREALVLTDPPRSGMSAQLRHRLAGWHPRRILMLACNPATWARDTAHLIDRGYALTHLELVDLFPSTHHIEVLAVFETE
jgi:tRNA/tmRNA/rRNA uracil-C5-methylase (TrmA/RlmC/RlmD family)